MKLEPPPNGEVGDLVAWLRAYASERINSATIDERRCLPPHVVLDFGNRGILGMLVEKRYGGLGFGHAQAATVLEQLGAIDGTVCLFVGLNNYLGIRPIAGYATAAVKDELLPLLATGRELAAFALTEPGAGSNPRAMLGRAEAVRHGEWRLYGTKYWIGAAQWAGLMNVFVREGSTFSVGCHLVRQGTPGLRLGAEAPTMGMRGMIQNTIVLDGVRSLEGERLGREGEGMSIAQDTMTHGRLAIAAMCIGAIQRCAQLGLRYASRRQVSTGRLLANPTTLEKLGAMTAAVMALRCLVYRLANAADAAQQIPVEAFAACKVAAPEFLWRATDDLMQLLGGRGYTENTPVPQMMRDARVLRIFEGPTETMSTFLGARLMGSPAGLTKLIGETLKAPHLVPQLGEVADMVARAAARAQETLGTGSILWGQMRAGKLASWLTLQAALEGQQSAEPQPEVARSLLWVKAHLQRELRDLQYGIPEEATYLDEPALTALVESFRHRIGDVVQTLPPMDYTPDPLLSTEQATPASSLSSD
ncbi:MAG: hypothetical protein RL033_4376 [Pseudomonadota bacterium]|jgi:alkylation response protein AidB-like acyl-CoA dehydrogenase